MSALLQVRGRGWIQESYETGAPELKQRAKALRAAGYRVASSSMGQQVTQWGRVKLTMLDIRPGASGDSDLEGVGRNPAGRRRFKRMSAAKGLTLRNIANPGPWRVGSGGKAYGSASSCCGCGRTEGAGVWSKRDGT